MPPDPNHHHLALLPNILEEYHLTNIFKPKVDNMCRTPTANDPRKLAFDYGPCCLVRAVLNSLDYICCTKFVYDRNRRSRDRRSGEPLILGPRSKIQHHHQKIYESTMKQPGKFLKSRPNYSQAKYVSRTAVLKRSAQHSRCLRAGAQALQRKMRIQFTSLNAAEYNSQITGRSFDSNLQPHDVFLGSKDQSTGRRPQVGAASFVAERPPSPFQF